MTNDIATMATYVEASQETIHAIYSTGEGKGIVLIECNVSPHWLVANYDLSDHPGYPYVGGKSYYDRTDAKYTFTTAVLDGKV